MLDEHALMPPTGSSWIAAALASSPSRRTTPGLVTPTVNLVAGPGAGVSRSLGRDALMPSRLENGLRDGRAASRVPRDCGRSGDGRQPGLIQRPGLRLAAGPGTRVQLSGMSVPARRRAE